MAHIQKSNDASERNLPLAGSRVVDTDDHHARIVSIQQTGDEPTAVLQIENGPEVVLPVSLLTSQQGDAYRLPFAFGTLSSNRDSREQVTMPVWREELNVGKRTADTGKGVRVHKTVSHREQIIDETLLQDELVVEHVPVSQIISADQLPATRYEGDTLIVPILEEVLVIEKQLRLKEEVRITRYRHEVHAPQKVLLKSEQASVEHFDERGQPAHGGDISPSSTRGNPGPGKPAG